MVASVLDNEISYLGIASEDITAGSDGKVTFFGKISGVDTSSFSDGDILWLDQGVNGGLTATEPSLGIKIPAAYVINAAANGTIMARWSRSPGLHDLHDVTLTSETNNEILQYNSSNSSWRNRTFTEADIATSTALTALDTAAVKTTTQFGGDVTGTYNNLQVTNDSHQHQFSNITSKPTTLSGYGITDGISTTGGSSSNFLKADGSTDSSAYVTGLTLDQVTSKDTATSAISTSATTIEAGRGSGSVALTTNDGQGNANVTFNHKGGVPDSAGNVGRITVNTDSTTGASMSFQLLSNSGTTVVSSVAQLILNETSADFQNNSITTTGTVTSAGFTGDLTGTATRLNINTSSSTSNFPVTWHSGTLSYSTSNVTIQPSTGKLTAGGGFVGDLTGNADSADAVAWTGVSSTPTTVSGYGITDALTTNTTQNISGVKEFQDDIELRFGASADTRIEWLGASNIMYSRIVTDGGYYQWAADDAGTTVRNVMLAGDIDGNSTSQVRLYYQGAEKLRTKSDGITVTGTVYSTEGNSSQWDQAYDNHITNVSFNTTNGVLTLTQQDGGTLTQDLDGRYLTAATNNYVTDASFNIGTEILTLTRQGLSSLTTSFAGYLKDGEANNYVHPNDGGGNQTALTGATVYSDIAINALGHVTSTTTRNLTPANIGAAPAGGSLGTNWLANEVQADVGVVTDKIRVYSGTQLVLNAGESNTYATGQTAEAVYINAESGLTVTSSPDNWGSAWGGRKTAVINNPSGDSSFPGDIAVTGTVDGRDVSADGAKLDTIANGAQVNVGTNLGQSRTGSSFTVTSSTGSNVNLSAATTTLWGVMTDEDKSKLDGIDTSATNTADPAITTNGSTPSLASGITALEVRNLIGAGTATVNDTGTPAILSNGSTPSLNSGISATEVRSLIGAGTGNGNGDITGVTAGLGLYGGGTSGSVTINQYSSVTAGGTTSLADGAFRTVTVGAIQLSLPASPAAGDTVYISNGPYTNTTVARNGQRIMGLLENLTLDVANIGITLIFADSTRGWRIM
jgi:hypothetical protein